MKIDRIISLVTLGTSLVAVVLVLKKPAPVAAPQTPAAAAANAQSFENKLQQLDQQSAAGQASPEVRLTAGEVSAALAQAVGGLPNPATPAGSQTPVINGVATTPPVASGGAASSSSPDAQIAQGEANVKDYQVNFDGDIARGQFLVPVGGKDVWVTLSGHLGSKDGYATFDPTEFKVGDLSVPVSLVNGALQRKLEEQKDRLKLPDSVAGIKVENGELVMTEK